MILRAKADSLELDAGENGWSLIAETDEGDTIVLNIHACAHEFAKSKGLAELHKWNWERTWKLPLSVEGDHLG